MSIPRSVRRARRSGHAICVRRQRLDLRPVLTLLAASVLLVGCASAPAATSEASRIASGEPTAPEPTSAPSPAPASGDDAIVTAFLGLTQAPDRSAHLEATGVVRFAGAEMRLRAAYDLHGDDYRGSSTVEAAAFGTMTVVSAAVDGVGYTSSNGTDWTGSQTSPPSQDPLRGIANGDVEYAGEVDVGGSPGHRLLLRDPVGAFTRAMSPTSPGGMGAITPTRASFEVRVDGQGRPVSATVSVRGTATTVGEIEVDFEYAFSDWGAVGPIEPPIAIPPPGDPGDVLTVHNRITSDILVRDGNGVELPVPACGSASAATFEVSRFDVLLASTGDIIYAEFPSEGSFVTRVVVVGADFYQLQPGAYLAELPPCRDRVAQ